MLRTWLTCIPRHECDYEGFDVIDVVQTSPVFSEIRAHLIDLVVAARLSSTFLNAMQQRLGWDTSKAVVAGLLPRNETARRGEFGEVLINAILLQHYGYSVPVVKLQFKITAGQSLPGTDSLAFKIDQHGEVSEVCYIESKLRTGKSDFAAIEAYEQLKNDYDSETPAMLVFVASQLERAGSELFDPVMAYLRDRRDTTDKDTFCISLCWEDETWREQALKNLHDHGVDLPRLGVHVIRISGLREVTNEVFDALGLATVEDDPADLVKVPWDSETVQDYLAHEGADSE